MKKIACSALALDLDGTLTNSKKEITQATKSAVKEVISRGIHVILASGRPVLGIKPTAEALGLYESGGFILAYNGGQIIDCKTNEVIFERLLPMEYYGEICNLAREMGLNALTYDDFGVLAECDTARYVLKEAYNNSIPIKKVENLVKAVPSPVIKFMIVGEPDKIATCLPIAQKVFSGRINVFLSEPYFMELTFPSIEKASALGILMEYLKLDKSKLVACGDGLNDLPMLRFAGYAVAMENAYDEVKDVADYITLSNDEDGVADFLCKYILH